MSKQEQQQSTELTLRAADRDPSDTRPLPRLSWDCAHYSVSAQLRLDWCGLAFRSCLSFSLLAKNPLAELQRLDAQFRFTPVQWGLPRLVLREYDAGRMALNEIHFVRLRAEEEGTARQPPLIQLVKKSKREAQFNAFVEHKASTENARHVRDRLALSDQMHTLFETAEFKALREHFSEPNRTCPNEMALFRILAAEYSDHSRLLDVCEEHQYTPQSPQYSIRSPQYWPSSPQYAPTSPSYEAPLDLMLPSQADMDDETVEELLASF